jgi:hypothetical protein
MNNGNNNNNKPKKLTIIMKNGKRTNQFKIRKMPSRRLMKIAMAREIVKVCKILN